MFTSTAGDHAGSDDAAAIEQHQGAGDAQVARAQLVRAAGGVGEQQVVVRGVLPVPIDGNWLT